MHNVTLALLEIISVWVKYYYNCIWIRSNCVNIANLNIITTNILVYIPDFIVIQINHQRKCHKKPG